MQNIHWNKKTLVAIVHVVKKDLQYTIIHLLVILFYRYREFFLKKKRKVKRKDQIDSNLQKLW